MKIKQEVLNVLGRMEPDMNVLRITDGQLDRKLYTDTNQVLEAMGGKWNRKQQGHVFAEDPALLLDSVLLLGEITVPKDFGFFPTPPDLAAKTIERAGIKPGHRILEPSAGTGNMIRPIHESCEVVAVEIDQKLATQLLQIRDSNLFVHRSDFLQCNGDLGKFDRIVMNPPFAKQADIDHVMHAWKFLKPGGRLVSIMSAGIDFRDNRKSVAFRSFLADAYNGTVYTNPPGSFKPSGTDVSTLTVVMDKKP